MLSPIENSPDHLRLLGTIAARWASLDFALVHLIRKALKSFSMAEAIYFSSASQKLRFDQIRAIVTSSTWSETEKTQAIKLVDKLNKLWKVRNDIMHNPAVADRVGPTAKYHASLTKPAAKTPKSKIPLGLSMLREHADLVAETGGKIFDIAWSEEIKILESRGQTSLRQTRT